MLRITEIANCENVTLKLEGKLLQSWLAELHVAWNSVAARGQTVRLDLAQLSFADGSGIESIRALVGSGAHISACSDFISELLRSGETMNSTTSAVTAVTQTRGLLENADDDYLLECLRAKDEQAYETLVRRYGGRMLTVARRFLPREHEAADAVQDAFIAAFKAIDSFQENARLWTWLYRIVVNACLMKIRSGSRARTVSIEECLPSFDETGHHTRHPRQWTEDAHDVACRQELRQRVRDAIEMLPESYRTVVLLRDIEQRDTEETAQLLGCTIANVKTRLHRARQALRTLLEPSVQTAMI